MLPFYGVCDRSEAGVADRASTATEHVRRTAPRLRILAERLAMHRRRATMIRASLRRRCCAAIALFAYLTAAVGLPVPAAALPNSGEAFPCQSLVCGCASAEQCRSCGCFTPEEHRAWEQAQGVAAPTAPPLVETRKVSLTSESSNDDEASSPCCCCGGAKGTSCCGSAKSCCQTRKSDPPKPEAPPSSGARSSLTLSTRSCQGMSTHWISLGAASPAAPPLVWRPGFAAGDRLPGLREAPLVAPHAPLAPPPRLVPV
jgi:hypothetical protein